MADQNLKCRIYIIANPINRLGEFKHTIQSTYFTISGHGNNKSSFQIVKILCKL